MAEPIELPFGLWTRVGRRKHKLNHIRQVAPMCQHGRAHWHHLANKIELSICGSDVVLCQITLTTCYIKQLSNNLFHWHFALTEHCGTGGVYQNVCGTDRSSGHETTSWTLHW